MTSPTDPRPKGLTHNPFARLRPDGRPANPTGPTHVHREETVPVPTPASGRVIVRRRSKGLGGKTVTIAEGPGMAGQDLGTLAREAARSLGLGARVENESLVIQGDQAERLVGWLEARGFGPITRGN